MSCGAFRPESADTVRSACPVCLASGNASTVPSLIPVTSSRPPGLKAICRACRAWAKTAIRKPGGQRETAQVQLFDAGAGEQKQTKYNGNQGAPADGRSFKGMENVFSRRRCGYWI